MIKRQGHLTVRLTAVLLSILSGSSALAANPTAASPPGAQVITFVRFPDGTKIPNDTPLTDQFASKGVVFEVIYDTGPLVLTALDGILISGGPTGFFGDIVMKFVNGCAPTWVEIDMIGSAVGIGATMSVLTWDPADIPMVTTTSYVCWDSGVPLPMVMTAPPGGRITRLKYNGGLNVNGAATVGTLRFNCD